MEDRLQKIISQCGICSRREAEKWISTGRVWVNKQQAKLGDKADLEKDTIAIDGKPLMPKAQRHYLMLHKPPGYVSTLSDEKGRDTVADLIQDYGKRLWPVGRLDYMSEGLLLMTDDGDLTQTLLHPKHETPKEYLVWVRGQVEPALPILSAPMVLQDTGEPLAPAKVKICGTNQDITTLSFTIHQGKNRQLRRMCAQVDLQVLRLKRVREGTLVLDKQLKPGKWRELTPGEIALLKEGERE